MNSRFYDANTGRFINADSPEYVSIQGGNLFAYCGNCPTKNADYHGFCYVPTYNESYVPNYGELEKNLKSATFYKVALAVQTPNSLNSTVAFNLGEKSAGHAFIILYKGSNKPIARGFSSEYNRTIIVALSRLSFKGKIANEKTLDRDATAYYNITSKQYEIIYKYLYRTDVPNYNIVSYNCATFAIEALEKAGIKHGFKKHMWNLGPIVCVSWLATAISLNYGIALMQTSAMQIATFILSFKSSYGYYPARLAYDIEHGIK